MKRALSLLAVLVVAAPAFATTINMVPVYQPLSLHGTDSDGVISDIGEALQATVMSTPMVLTGSFPETLVEFISQPHKVPTNNPNYKTPEANLMVLCHLGIAAEMSEGGGTLRVRLDVSKLSIPSDIDLTSRQVLKLTLVAIRKTLEEYQKLQTSVLDVAIQIEGAEGGKEPLRDLSAKIQLAAGVDN
ncbi:hypothetical protein KBB96_05500 [Luteolibacter ambystomatis]|uniref:Uncharacterized protein n=1 Tax=Luteolibacter ambystomatis TaxID=2824561 RepID=A0A975PG75_9BACT|nr:hypothetical protein [Luteolibacter ambystomatis]QUE52345.1 hypothetical protein KBB96_05500 [Luteolibacter ambystomatis]